MVSASISTGVSPSSTVATIVDDCTQVVGSGIDIIGIAVGVVVLGIRVATPGDPSLFMPGSGDSDGSITDIGPIIEPDCCCNALPPPPPPPPLLLLLLSVALVEVTSVDSRLCNSSALAKSSSSLV